MPLVKYIGNADPEDGTAAIRLEASEGGQERVLHLGRDLDLTPTEFAQLRGRFRLEEVLEEVDEPAVEDTTKPDAPDSTLDAPKLTLNLRTFVDSSTPSTSTPSKGN